MARIHEYQGKALLSSLGVSIPPGRPAYTPDEVREAAAELGGSVVLKAQAWVTGRFSRGLILFASSPDDAEVRSRELFGRVINNFPVECVLVERRLQIESEYYAGIIISDTSRKPELIFSARGGTGIEQIAAEHPESVARTTIDIRIGLSYQNALKLISHTGLDGEEQSKLAEILVKLWTTARSYEARSAEINPIVRTGDGSYLAADCRITIDDYAVFRHPELEISIAREFDHPPTRLEKIAWDIEKNDYRGTFYFIQLEQGFKQGDRFVGFHGAGGGGSMMSMDAIQSQGYRIANFTDTSGNPPASKVYRAARIILSQPGINGYFGSGSGVASQEQVNSARGLVKAFREAGLAIPAVVRLGGNMEDEAVEILTRLTADLPATVEGYKKDDSAAFCARRMDELIKNARLSAAPIQQYTAKNLLLGAVKPYRFKTLTGEVVFDHECCAACESKACISSSCPGVLELRGGLPQLAIPEEKAAKGGCTECLACELECWFRGNRGCYVSLPVPGLEEDGGAE